MKIFVIVLTIMAVVFMSTAKSQAQSDKVNTDVTNPASTGTLEKPPAITIPVVPAMANLIRASEIIGKSVSNPSGEDLGKIADVVFDSEGKVSYAVIGYGGVLGIGDKLVPVPWQSFKAGILPGKDRLIANIDKTTLEQAPNFQSDKWPNLAENEWVQKIYNYFGLDHKAPQKPDADKPR